jgi:hypothetical protein
VTLAKGRHRDSKLHGFRSRYVLALSTQAEVRGRFHLSVRL